MKTKIEENKRYKVTPKKVIGKDGKEYNVIATWARTRAGKRTSYMAITEGEVCVEVQVLKIIDKKIALCKVLNRVDARFAEFSKKPYVRGDGTFTVCVPTVTYPLHFGSDFDRYFPINENNFTEI